VARAPPQGRGAGPLRFRHAGVLVAGASAAHDVVMAQVIKINAITVPEGSGDELGKRFAARASSC